MGGWLKSRISIEGKEDSIYKCSGIIGWLKESTLFNILSAAIVDSKEVGWKESGYLNFFYMTEREVLARIDYPLVCLEILGL